MFFAVIARDKPGSGALRADTKARHTEHLDAGAPGLRVLQSGPLLDASGRECGSLLVIEAADGRAVDAFLADDPYRRAGLFASAEVHPWMWRRGNPYLAPAGGAAP